MENNNKSYRIVVLGGDHYNTYGIVRSLGEEGINSYVLILGCHYCNSFVLRSKYIKKGFGCITHEEAVNCLISNFDNNADNIVICCSDEAEELVLYHYEELTAHRFVLPVCHNYHETFRLMNKSVITELAKDNGIKVPQTWRVIGRQIEDGILYPCITKPMTSTSGHKSDIIVCKNEESLRSVVEDPNRCSDYVVQEYIDFEKEISILGVVLEDGEVLLSGCIDKLRTCAIGTTSFGMMVDNKILGDNVAKLEKMMAQTGYRGLFSAEFLRKGDTYYFLEVNFRNDGNTYVATASGLNLPLLYVQSFIDNTIQTTIEPRFPCYFMLDIEDVRARRKNKVSKQQWKKDYKLSNCCLVKNMADKAPYRKKRIKTAMRPFMIVLHKLGLK